MVRVEWYARHFDDPDPDCEQCGSKTIRQLSTFGVVFTGTLTTRYNDPKLEGYHKEGFWAVRKRTSKTGRPLENGKLEHEFIDTWDKRKKFLKDEGLAGREHTGPIHATSDGRVPTTRTGLPGSEV